MKEEIKNRLDKLEKQGWILIGELEYEGNNPFGTGRGDLEPFFLYVKYSEYGYTYSFCKGITSVCVFDYFILEKRYSINTILCSYISQDRLYGRLDNGNWLGQKADGLKIRLTGYKDWIEVDEDFLNGKINLAELEQKFRTEKEKEWFASFQDNEFCTNKEEMKTAKIYT